MSTVIELTANRVTLIAGTSRESFAFTSEDEATLQACAADYSTALEKSRPPFGRPVDTRAELVDIGARLATWLNRGGWLARLLEEVTPVWDVQFKVGRRPTAAEKVFLNAPWELLAWEGQHLAVEPTVQFNPTRQLGQASKKLSASTHRLNLLFMAAAPDAAGSLAYEQEELAILNATRQDNLDLTVEETGTLAELAEEVARYEPDVLHVSCHGGFDSNDNPVLWLEDEAGQTAVTQAGDWLGQPSLCNVAHLKLAFISACHTAHPAPQVADSLATQLLAGGVPAVLGWGSSVGDVEATLFAHTLVQS